MKTLLAGAVLILWATGPGWTHDTEDTRTSSGSRDWPWCELGGTYSLPHKRYCDRYFTCQHGETYLGQCEDGLGFVPFKGCKLLHLVNCLGRAKLQAPKGHGECPRLYGITANPHGCGTFLQCDNGTAVVQSCPIGLVFDNGQKVCRSPTPAERENCLPPGENNPPGFKCPKDDMFPFGDHSRYPYPENCSLFIMCLKDGSLKVGSCEPGTSYSPITNNCDLSARVPGCNAQQRN